MHTRNLGNKIAVVMSPGTPLANHQVAFTAELTPT